MTHDQSGSEQGNPDALQLLVSEHHSCDLASQYDDRGCRGPRTLVSCGYCNTVLPQWGSCQPFNDNEKCLNIVNCRSPGHTGRTHLWNIGASWPFRGSERPLRLAHHNNSDKCDTDRTGILHCSGKRRTSSIPRNTTETRQMCLKAEKRCPSWRVPA